jgi:hypothetical protein
MPRDLAPFAMITIVVALGLACVVETSSSSDSVGESGMVSESGITGESGLASESGSESSSTESIGDSSESGSESSSSESIGDSSETATESSTDSSTDGETGTPGPTPDLGVLALVDVNPNSASFGQKVHPLDHAGELSGWYFGHAT